MLKIEYNCNLGGAYKLIFKIFGFSDKIKTGNSYISKNSQVIQL